MVYKKWATKAPNKEQSETLQQSLEIGGLLSDVLVARGLTTADKARTLLSHNQPLPDPASIKDMDKAVQRIHQALQQDETMVIFGDYDVDGITATAVLYSYLESQGAQVFYKLPNRHDDEYGLMPDVVDQVAQHNIDLIITVDNGVTAFEAAKQAEKHGIDIVVTDHHLPMDTLPDVVAVVDPCREDDTSGYDDLAGVGVAYMLVCALEGCAAEELLPVFADLVAIGTIADIMQLCGHNRVLVREGLLAIEQTVKPGLLALLEICGLTDKKLTADNISFGMAPRLNAAGRMDDATLALKLLLTEDEAEAASYVAALQQLNEDRQLEEKQMLDVIVKEIDEDSELQQSRVLVVWGDNWHQGVAGIVCSRLVEQYGKPSIIICLDGAEGKGSGRSVRGFSLYDAIAACADDLERFGGHELAAGLSINRKNLKSFRRNINSWAKTQFETMPVQELCADVKLTEAHISVPQVEELDKLDPCGSGNPSPCFLLEDAVIEAVYALTDGKHSRLKLRKGNTSLYAALFGTGPAELAYQAGDHVDLMIDLSIYEGRYGKQLSARVEEIRPAGLSNEHVKQNQLFNTFINQHEVQNETARQLLKPTRDETAAVYIAIRDGKQTDDDLRPLFSAIGEGDTAKILTSLAVLEELNLIKRVNGSYVIVPQSQKQDLSTSAILQQLEVC